MVILLKDGDGNGAYRIPKRVDVQADSPSAQKIQPAARPRTENASGQGSLVLTVAHQHLAVHDRGVHPHCARQQPSRTPRQVGDVLSFERIDGVGIEEHQVRSQALGDAPAVLDAEEARRHRREQTYTLLERERFALAHPVCQQVGGITGVAEHVDVRTAVAQSDEKAPVLEKIPHALDLEVGDFGVEQNAGVGDRQVEHRIQSADAAGAAEVCDTAA